MVAKVRLTYSVECLVKAEDDAQLQDWLNQHTPEDALYQANGSISENYDEEIICHVKGDYPYDIDITKEAVA